MLSWNLLSMKKTHFYAEHCQDQELKTAFDRCGQMHQRHYEKILTHLSGQNSASNREHPTIRMGGVKSEPKSKSRDAKSNHPKSRISCTKNALK